jgi:tripartite-type tricarboxylate transporter receptor subunit TctC
MARDRLRWFFALALLVAGFSAGPARAEDYPARPVRLITDSAAGSAIDATARIVADGLTRTLGQQVVVVNTPGAGGSIAARAAAQATPDGYTLYMPSFSAFVAEPGAAGNLPIQAPRDFIPIGYLSGGPMFITAASWLKVKTLADLIALAKSKPGELSYGTNGPGRLTHLTGELLQARTGIKLQMIPYSGGTSKVLIDVLGGRVPLVFEAYSGLAAAIQGGSLVPLAVASAQRLPDFPDLPTVAETLPGFEAAGWQILVAPVGMPDAIVQKANAALNKAMTDPEIRERIRRVGRYERPMSAAETAAFIQAEQRKWEPVQKSIGHAR